MSLHERISCRAVYDFGVLLHDDTFRRVCRARDLLASQFDGRVLLARAAQEACLSEFHFHRLFHTTFGETPHAFMTRLRMERAKQMLASGKTATEVCFAVGYESLGSFSTKFRTQFGYSPGAFQREVCRVFGYSAPWRILMVPECFLQAWSIAE
jgi:AraC-like DNA-binding protein